MRHDDAAKEWGALGARSLVPSAITYKPKINSRDMQGERTRDGVQQEGGESDGDTDRILGQPGQAVVPAESRSDVSAHGFWKRGTTTSDSEIQHPAPTRPSRQRGVHLVATGADGWSGDATARALAWIDLGRQNWLDRTG